MALVDAASDFLDHNHNDTRDANGFLHGSGLRGHRLPNRLYGDKYLQDLAAVMNDLRGRYPNLPLWAVGTSQGTISAAVAAANVSPPPDGIVLTSSLTGPSALEDLQSVDLEAINVPALIVTNQDDACSVTKPEDSQALRCGLRRHRESGCATSMGEAPLCQIPVSRCLVTDFLA